MPANYLYIEDDALSREVMETLLVEVIGAGVTVFENSENFIQRLKSLQPKPDYILLDINIAPFNGYQVLEMIRREPLTQDYEVLVVTAGVISKIMDDLKAKGFSGAIAKPLDMLTFPELIRRLESGESIWQSN